MDGDGGAEKKYLLQWRFDMNTVVVVPPSSLCTTCTRSCVADDFLEVSEFTLNAVRGVMARGRNAT